MMEGLTLLTEALGITLAAMLERTDRIVHGTTVATNALLERRGARVGLLTTEGHIDILEMREGLKDDRYNLRVAPPEPRAPRVRRLGVQERISTGRSRRGDAQQCVGIGGHPGTEAPESSNPRCYLLPAQLPRPDT